MTDDAAFINMVLVMFLKEIFSRDFWVVTQNVKVNDKKIPCKCHCQKGSSQVKSRTFQKPRNFSKPHNTSKVHKHPGLSLKIDIKLVPAALVHASLKKPPVASGSKLLRVHKLTV